MGSPKQNLFWLRGENRDRTTVDYAKLNKSTIYHPKFSEIYSDKMGKRAEANSGAQQRVNTVNNFFFNQVKRATQLLQWNKEMKK